MFYKCSINVPEMIRWGYWRLERTFKSIGLR